MNETSAPAATYRLQFNSEFRFSHAIELIEYLAKLGITDVYASPILTSRKGSRHGYDLTDPTQIDPDIGTLQEFEQFQDELLKHGMRVILDIVPNHMAASSENRWWMDVLESGRESNYASFFDIDWIPPSRNLEGKVLLPVLGRPFGEVLDRGELSLVFQGGKFVVKYFESSFPLAPSTYHRILGHRVDELKEWLSEDSSAFQEYSGIIAGLLLFSEPAQIRAPALAERRVRLDEISARLQGLLASDPRISKFIDKNIADFNGTPGDAASLCSLEHLLDEQKFRLAYWLDPNEGINYRRFFAISDLVGVRVEDALVFSAIHDQILRLLSKGAIRGVRVDHIDGLRDPVGYLNRLQERLLSALPPDSSRPFVWVEKILSPSEVVPEDWQTAGTTGYEYLNAANGLFVSASGAECLRGAYLEFIGKPMDFAGVMYDKKKLVMNTLLHVEMQSLGRQLAQLAAHDRYARNIRRRELMEALIEVTASFPVYRTYIRNLDVPDSSKQVIEYAIGQARSRLTGLSPASFDFLSDVLSLANPPHILSDQREERLAFVMRWQQFTGPIVAKGVEDTALFVFYPLLSLNEVGGNPEPAAVASQDRFFELVRHRQHHWPDALNATSTHDTKLSEDVRARINVLSEIPDEWMAKVAEWSRENEARKLTIDGRKVPDANEEYLIYQALLGLWTTNWCELPALCERLQAYMVKAIREAMIHTRWTEPNGAHEAAIRSFIERILQRQDSRPFLCDFARFQKKVAYAGMSNGLGQTLLKIACPGVPDFYQGSELWDRHLVDPDNRHPVDFQIRIKALQELENSAGSNTPGLAKELSEAWPDGRIKLYVIWKALGFRHLHPALFREGEFLPVEVAGDRSQHMISFFRRRGNEQALVVIPRCVMSIPQSSMESAHEDFWKGTTLRLPSGSPDFWVNLFSTTRIASQDGMRPCSLAAGELLRDFPVALLKPMEESNS